MFVVAKRLGGLRYRLVRWKAWARGNIVLDADLALQGAQPPNFGPRQLWPNGRPFRPSQLLLSTCYISDNLPYISLYC